MSPRSPRGNSFTSKPPGRTPCKAINVSLQPPAAVHPGADRYKEITQLRYVGFRHLENLRHFRFERITPGAPTQCFEVAANLALFHTLRIAIQEGPALCMRVIAAELEAGRNWEDLACCPLTEQHMRDYLASRPVPGAKAAQGPAASVRLFGARTLDLRAAGPCR